MLQRYEGVTSRDCSFLWLDSFEEEREKYSDRYPFKDGRTFAAGLLCHVNFTCPFGIARGGVGSWLTRAWYLYWLEIKFVFQNDLIVTKSQNELSSNIKRGLQCRWPLLRCRFCRGNIFHGEFITLFPLDSFFFYVYIIRSLWYRPCRDNDLTSRYWRGKKWIWLNVYESQLIRNTFVMHLFLVCLPNKLFIRYCLILRYDDNWITLSINTVSIVSSYTLRYPL